MDAAVIGLAAFVLFVALATVLVSIVRWQRKSRRIRLFGDQDSPFKPGKPGRR